MSRVACLLVPDLPLAAERRAHPETEGRPLALVSAPVAHAAHAGRSEVVAVSAEARAHGVRAGASLAHARAACPTLCVRAVSPSLVRAARAALLDAALSHSPRAAAVPDAAGTLAGEGAVLLAASGIGSLFRSEEAFASALAARAASLGLPAVAGVAASQGVARLAARRLAWDGGTGRVLVVPPGGEPDFLAPLPVDILDLSDALAASLTRFGVRCLGDLARLPARALATRLGPELRPLLALLRGEETAPPLPRHRETRCEEDLDLEHPVERLEPLGFVLRGMLSRLVARLDARGLACGPLELSLALVGGRRDARRIGVATPTGDVRTLLRLVTLALEQRPPEAPVAGVALATRGRAARRDQLDLFRPAGPAPAELSRTLAELEALCGEGRVGAPVVCDAHRPDAWGLRPFSLGPETDTRGGATGKGRREAGPRSEPRAAGAQASAEVTDRATPAAPAGRLGLRALRPPQPAEVTAPGGRPGWVRSRVASGRVVALSGPFRTTGGWWSPERRHAFDHWDVETQDGVLARLRFDRLARRWEIDGVYD